MSYFDGTTQPGLQPDIPPAQKDNGTQDNSPFANFNNSVSGIPTVKFDIGTGSLTGLNNGSTLNNNDSTPTNTVAQSTSATNNVKPSVSTGTTINTTNPIWNIPQGYKQTSDTYSIAEKNSHTDWDKVNDYIDKAGEDFDRDYKPTKDRQSEYLRRVVEIKHRFDPTTRTPEKKAPDPRLNGYLMLANAFTKLASTVGEQMGNYNGGGRVKRRSDLDTFDKDYAIYENGLQKEREYQSKAAQSQIQDALSILKAQNDFDMAEDKARRDALNGARKEAINKYTYTNEHKSTFKSPETIENEKKSKSSSGRRSSRRGGYSSGGTGNGSFTISSPSYKQNRFAKTPEHPQGDNTSYGARDFYNNKGLSLTSRQIETMYASLMPYLKDFNMDYIGKWSEAQTLKAKADDLNNLAKFLSGNRTTEYINRSKVSKLFGAFMLAYNNAVYGHTMKTMPKGYRTSRKSSSSGYPTAL